jgi:hypothetical protein
VTGSVKAKPSGRRYTYCQHATGAVGGDGGIPHGGILEQGGVPEARVRHGKTEGLSHAQV